MKIIILLFIAMILFINFVFNKSFKLNPHGIFIFLVALFSFHKIPFFFNTINE